MSNMRRAYLCTNCAQPVGYSGQKPADKRAQVVHQNQPGVTFCSDESDNSGFCGQTNTFYTLRSAQAKPANRPKLMDDLSPLSTAPTITTITYI